MAAGLNLEIEIKLRVADADTGRKLLEREGFRESKPRVFETNTLYDTADQALRAKGELLRLREVGGMAVLTYKGPSQKGIHKTREEIETAVGSAAQMAAILSRLSFRPTFRYEKYRTEFLSAEGLGTALLDETPIGTFLELEGEGYWIDRVAESLGFSKQDYVTASYGALYLGWCSEQGIEAKEMVFPQGEP
jgi:adenylate cyclase class 2